MVFQIYVNLHPYTKGPESPTMAGMELCEVEVFGTCEQCDYYTFTVGRCELDPIA